MLKIIQETVYWTVDGEKFFFPQMSKIICCKCEAVLSEWVMRCKSGGKNRRPRENWMHQWERSNNREWRNTAHSALFTEFLDYFSLMLVQVIEFRESLVEMCWVKFKMQDSSHYWPWIWKWFALLFHSRSLLHSCWCFQFSRTRQFSSPFWPKVVRRDRGRFKQTEICGASFPRVLDIILHIC